MMLNVTHALEEKKLLWAHLCRLKRGRRYERLWLPFLRLMTFSFPTQKSTWMEVALTFRESYRYWYASWGFSNLLRWNLKLDAFVMFPTNIISPALFCLEVIRLTTYKFSSPKAIIARRRHKALQSRCLSIFIPANLLSTTTQLRSAFVRRLKSSLPCKRISWQHRRLGRF